MAKKTTTTVKRNVRAGKSASGARPRAFRTDRCQPLRAHLERVNLDIAKDREDLAQPDIPKDVKAKIREHLKKLEREKAAVVVALARCEDTSS